MTDKLVQAQQRVRDLAAKVEALTVSVVKRPTEKKAAELQLAMVRLAKAEATAAQLSARAAIKDRKRQRQALFVAGMTKRLDALAAAAPAISKQWAEDRAKEPKRIRKLKAALAKRTSRDYSARPDWARRPVALPPPVEQPKDLDAPEPAAAPPRDGLIPGTYKLVEPRRLGSLLDAPALPRVWTWRHVAQRLMDAFSTLRCMPERDKPKSYGACWPSYRHEAGELAVQAGSGTLLLGRNRIRRVPSADEIALMDEALTWIGQYLSGTNAWARTSLIYWADDPNSEIDDADAPVDMLEFIATALNAERRVVR